MISTELRAVMRLAARLDCAGPESIASAMAAMDGPAVAGAPRTINMKLAPSAPTPETA